MQQSALKDQQTALAMQLWYNSAAMWAVKNFLIEASKNNNENKVYANVVKSTKLIAAIQYILLFLEGGSLSASSTTVEINDTNRFFVMFTIQM